MPRRSTSCDSDRHRQRRRHRSLDRGGSRPRRVVYSIPREEPSEKRRKLLGTNGVDELPPSFPPSSRFAAGTRPLYRNGGYTPMAHPPPAPSFTPRSGRLALNDQIPTSPRLPLARRYPCPPGRQVRKVIDRSTTCPFLLRVYFNLNDHHSVELFESLLLDSSSLEKVVLANETSPVGLAESELQIYTWRDASSRELVELIKDVCPEARQRSCRLSLKLLHYNRDKYSEFNLGNLHSFRPGPDDRKTLLDTPFDIGDILSLAILPNRGGWKTENNNDLQDKEAGAANKDNNQQSEKNTNSSAASATAEIAKEEDRDEPMVMSTTTEEAAITKEAAESVNGC